MPHTVQIGPVVLPVALLFMFVAVFSAGYIAKRTSDSPTEVDSVLWQAGLLGLVAARAAFVLEYFSSFHQRSSSVNHVIHDDAVAAFNAANDVHDFIDIGLRAAFVDDSKVTADFFSQGAGMHYTAAVG